MTQPQACPDCLRRARLLAHLAPYIERTATGAPGRRVANLLRLGNEDLTDAVAPQVTSRVLAQIAAVPERLLRDELAESGCWACCRHDRRFPAGLHDAADAPLALIGRGDPALLAKLVPETTVTLVGARRAS